MDFKFIGGVLLLVGTAIGAGMLGLPIAAAHLGFVGSALLLVLCWFVMTAGALLILEVNLWLPSNNNLISMAKKTIGPLGQLVAWLSYLLLLYSLLCAYIAGGSDLFRHLIATLGLKPPAWLASIIFTLILASVVYLGIRSVDYVNRGLMFLKFSAYFLLVLLLLPFITFDKLVAGDLHYLSSASALTVTATAFGYATVIPSLRVYFGGNLKKLKRAIILGSLIPLLCYLGWDAVIMGIIPLKGDQGLISIFHSSSSTSDLVAILDAQAASRAVNFFVKLFTSICVLTSFLGVSLCLTDFFADGLAIEKKGLGNLVIQALTFMPSLLIALYFPNIFISALEYAGIYTLILLILLPACMAWCGRYRRGLGKGFQVGGGKPFLLGLIIFSLVLIIKGILG